MRLVTGALPERESNGRRLAQPSRQTHLHLRKVTGPDTVTFEKTSSPVTTATFSKGGGYTLRLTVSDGDLSSSDDIAVNVRRK